MLSSRTHARKQGGYSQPVWPARVRPAYGEGQGISCPAWVLPGLTAPSYTLKEKPKPPNNHFGLCGLKRVWGSYPKQSELITANEWLHVTASSASFPCTYGPLARGREPNQGGIRTAGPKSIRVWGLLNAATNVRRKVKNRTGLPCLWQTASSTEVISSPWVT